jgi:hypothetical protein
MQIPTKNVSEEEGEEVDPWQRLSVSSSLGGCAGSAMGGACALDGAQRVIIIFPAQVVLEKKEESNRIESTESG